jgi:hypothetical protein
VTDAAIPDGGTEVLDPVWDPWRPTDIARLLAGVTVPWYVAAGWLRWALQRVHPCHVWIEALDRARAGRRS